MAIGLYDSGVGGLSIFREVKKVLPDEEYIFLADQGHVPYGEKTQAELQKLAERIAKFLLSKKADFIVVACNTSTCYAIDFLRKKFTVPIVGVVPAIKLASKTSRNNVIAVMSTPATAKSKYLKDLRSAFAKDKKTLLLGCKGLEDAMEILDKKVIDKLLNKYIRLIKEFGADTIVLGCTHYPFLKREIQNIVGNNVKIIDSGTAVAKRVKHLLTEIKSLRSKKAKRSDQFFTTGNPQEFSKVASKLLKYKVVAKKAYI